MLISKQPIENHPKRALILAGGGMRVAYQAGVMKAMQEEGLLFIHADGASGGILMQPCWLAVTLLRKY